MCYLAYCTGIKLNESRDFCWFTAEFLVSEQFFTEY